MLKRHSMDHRCGTRHASGQTVLLRRPGWAGYIVGQLRDISMSGAFIKVPRRIFPERSLVRAEVTVYDGDRPRLLRVQGMVVRAGEGGIGLMFDEIQPARLVAASGPATRDALLDRFPALAPC
jgi:hypothetical protein